MKKQILMILVMLVTVMSIIAQEADFPTLTSPYLGQKPQGITPEVFARGIDAGMKLHIPSLSTD